MPKITAPFTPAQVNALNAWQERDDVHEFTCGVSSSHPPLLATPSGWVCRRPECVYTQDWAHDHMASPDLPPWRGTDKAPSGCLSGEEDEEDFEEEEPTLYTAAAIPDEPPLVSVTTMPRKSENHETFPPYRVYILGCWAGDLPGDAIDDDTAAEIGEGLRVALERWATPQKVRCYWCDQTYPYDGTPEGATTSVAAHLVACGKHPVREMMRAREDEKLVFLRLLATERDKINELTALVAHLRDLGLPHLLAWQEQRMDEAAGPGELRELAEAVSLFEGAKQKV